MTATSPLGADTDLASFSVRVDGNALRDTVQVMGLYVHKEVNRIAEARITLIDGDPALGDFVLSGSADMAPGKAITISAGYAGNDAVLFSGIIVKHGVRVHGDGRSALVLTCYDQAVALTRARSSASPGATGSEIIQALIEGAGLGASVEASTPARQGLVGGYATDWDFVVGQAELNGKIVLVDDGKLTVAAPACGGAPVLRIGYGDALLDLDAEIDFRTQNDSGLSRPRGAVRFRGNASPKPGCFIELAGLGARFNGAAFVSRVVHRLEAGDWTTEVGFGLGPRGSMDQVPDVAAPVAPNRLPGEHGLLIGQVRKIDDPAGQARVQVDVPAIGPGGEDIWARVAREYATDKAGIFFVPEVGDEVVLGFVNGDPGQPVVLGSLHGGMRAPPFQADAANSTKAIVTNAQLKITMDDGRKCVQVETPGGHKITMNDEDRSVTVECSNGNKLHFAGAGITLESPADITIRAGARLKLEASGAISANAGAEIGLAAPQIAASAAMKLSMQGQAIAEVISAGQTTVRGALVMIN